MMKIDYNEKMKEIIRERASHERLLLHVCCAPCSTSVFERLTNFNVMPYFYNPNIDTEKEYFLRAGELAKLTCGNLRVATYAHNEFLDVVKGLENEPEGGVRCEKCIALRMERTAKMASEKKFDWFCSTLSVSPHKNAGVINEIGFILQEKYGVKYLPNDFKKEGGFLRSTTLARQYNLYRQNYCGCEFAKSCEAIKNSENVKSGEVVEGNENGTI